MKGITSVRYGNVGFASGGSVGFVGLGTDMGLGMEGVVSDLVGLAVGLFVGLVPGVIGGQVFLQIEERLLQGRRTHVLC